MSDSYRCECCNNPWNQSDSNSSVCSQILYCQPCLADDKGYSGIDPNNIDQAASLKENFYFWSNGNWKANNPIPSEYSSWNTFMALRDMNLDRLKVILEELQAEALAQTQGDTTINKLAVFYNTMMDEATIEAKRVEPLQPLVDILGTVSASASSIVARLHSLFGIRVFFSVYSSPDKRNSEHTLLTISQGGLGLLDKDYYFDEDKEEKRVKYVAYIARLFSLLGSTCNEFMLEGIPDFRDQAIAEAEAAAVFELEKVIDVFPLCADRNPCL